MSIARMTLLRANMNRRVTLSNPESTKICVDRLEMDIGRIVQVKQPAPSSKERPEGASDKFYRTGAIVQLSTESNIGILGRVAWVEYPAALYEHGIVSGPMMLTEFRTGPITFSLLVTKDVDLGDIGPVRVFIEGDV